MKRGLASRETHSDNVAEAFIQLHSMQLYTGTGSGGMYMAPMYPHYVGRDDGSGIRIGPASVSTPMVVSLPVDGVGFSMAAGIPAALYSSASGLAHPHASAASRGAMRAPPPPPPPPVDVVRAPKRSDSASAAAVAATESAAASLPPRKKVRRVGDGGHSVDVPAPTVVMARPTRVPSARYRRAQYGDSGSTDEEEGEEAAAAATRPAAPVARVPVSVLAAAAAAAPEAVDGAPISPVGGGSAAAQRFACRFCSYTGATSSYVRRHERVHTGEKPFACSHCDYRASDRSNVIRHERRVHARARPHACRFCDYTSADASHLRAHERVHTGERPFACRFCNYRAAESSNAVRHERRIHGAGQTPDDE